MINTFHNLDSLEKFRLLADQYDKHEMSWGVWGTHSICMLWDGERVTTTTDTLFECFQALLQKEMNHIAQMAPSIEKYRRRKACESDVNQILKRLEQLKNAEESHIADRSFIWAIFAAIGRAFRRIRGIKESTPCTDLLTAGATHLFELMSTKGDGSITDPSVADSFPEQCRISPTRVSCYDLLEHFVPELQSGSSYVPSGSCFKSLQAFWTAYKKITIDPNVKVQFEAVLKARCLSYLRALDAIKVTHSSHKVTIKITLWSLFGSDKNKKLEWPDILTEVIKEDIAQKLASCPKDSTKSVELCFMDGKTVGTIFSPYYELLTETAFFTHPNPQSSIVASIPNLTNIVFTSDSTPKTDSSHFLEAVKAIVVVQPRLSMKIMDSSSGVEWKIWGKYYERLVFPNEAARKHFKAEDVTEGMISIPTYLNTLLPRKAALIEEIDAFNKLHEQMEEANPYLKNLILQHLESHCLEYPSFIEVTGDTSVNIRVSLERLYGNFKGSINLDSRWGSFLQQIVMGQLSRTIQSHKGKQITIVFDPRDLISNRRAGILGWIAAGASSVTVTV